jgi:hypothetical protein
MKSPTITMRGPGPRLSYAYVIEGLTEAEVPKDHHINIWNMIVAAHLRGRPKAQTPIGVRSGRPGWTAEAAFLINPLRDYHKSLKSRSATFHARFRGVSVFDRDGTSHVLNDVYDQYVARCEEILDNLRSTLKAYGHLSNDATGHYSMSVKDIVADLRVQGRPAGTWHWSQWEDPATKRRLTYMLGQMYDAHAAAGSAMMGRRWYAYENGVKAVRAREEWMRAFTQWRAAEYDNVQGALDNANHAPGSAPADRAPFERFLSVLNSARLRQECEDAMHEQRALGHTPKRFPLEPWRTLSLDMRLALAQAHQDIVNVHIANGSVPSTSISFYQPAPDELVAAGAIAPPNPV